jgi:hypothetical protein
MTRGLLSGADALMTLHNELTAEKQQSTRPRQQQQQQQQQQNEQARGASPPLARQLLSNFDVAGPELGTAVDAYAAAADVSPFVGAAAEGVNQQQQQWLQVLQRVEQQQQRILQVLGSPLETETFVVGVLDPASASSGSNSSSSVKQQGALVPSRQQLADMQKVQQELLQQLQEATLVLLQGNALQQQQQQQSFSSPGRPQGFSLGPKTCQDQCFSIQLQPSSAADDAVDTPRAEFAAASVFDSLDAAAASANASAGKASGGTRSPTRRSQQRGKQREALRLSLDGLLLQQQQHGGGAAGSGSSSTANANRSDQQQLRDSCKEGRMQQLLRGAKATGSLLDGTAAAAASSCDDASCQTEDAELLPGTAAAASSRCTTTSPGVQLRVYLPGEEAPSTLNPAAAAAESDSAQVVQLRGKLAKLELQLEELRLRAQVAENLRDKALQQLPRSHSSCSSRGGEMEASSLLRASGRAGLRSSIEQQQQQGCASARDGASAAAAAIAQRAPLLPAGLFSPRREKQGGSSLVVAAATAAAHSAGGGSGLSRSFSGSAVGSLSSPGAASGGSFSGAAAVPQHMSLLLTGEVRKLQNECLMYMGQIRELQDTVRRQEMQLKQQGLPAAAIGSSSGGMRTPRAAGSSSGSGGSGLFSPRLGGVGGAGGSGLFSPRLVGTPVRAAAAAAAGEALGGSSQGAAVGASAAGESAGLGGGHLYGGLAVGGAAGGSPTRALKSPLGVKQCRSESSTSSWLTEGLKGGQQPGLGVSVGWSSHHVLDAVPEDSACVLRKDSRRFSTGGVSAAQQQQSSSRRLSFGAGGVGASRGVRMLAPGRLRVAAMTKAQQQRRQSMG